MPKVFYRLRFLENILQANIMAVIPLNGNKTTPKKTPNPKQGPGLAEPQDPSEAIKEAYTKNNKLSTHGIMSTASILVYFTVFR